MEDGLFRLAFHCLGCDASHVCTINEGLGRAVWGWNQNLDRPTLTPSVLLTTGRAVDPTFQPDPVDPREVFHSFVTDGGIPFLGDCTYTLAGQTVDLPERPK